MRFQPRRQILEIWHSLAGFSYDGRPWVWRGRDGRNSVTDGLQLLCLMYPATEVETLAFATPTGTTDDVIEALRPLGDAAEIPKVVVELIGEYLATYTSESGEPIFAGDTCFQSLRPGDEITKEQRELGVVASYSVSVSLMLCTLTFLKAFGRSVRQPRLLDRIAELEAAASNRLSAAMIGLLRSFCVYHFDPAATPGRALLETLNQAGSPDRIVLDKLRRTMAPVRAALRDATIGINKGDSFDEETSLFECGWSWGVVRNAPAVETTEPIGVQPEGIAFGRPNLHFTVEALDAITDLFSDRTRMLGLLHQEQQRLAQALQLRWNITMAYWSRIARLDADRWPLEDIPWRANDDDESPYFSLLVASLLVMDLSARRATDRDMARTISVLEELAVRGRINRRLTRNDPARTLHHPGVRLELSGAEELGAPMSWLAPDFATLLLKRAVRAAGLARDSAIRERLLSLADDAFTHLWKRRLKSGPAAGLWDDPTELVPGAEVDLNVPSWGATERMVECLVIASDAIQSKPIVTTQLHEITSDLLNQAEQLLSQEQFDTAAPTDSPQTSALREIETQLHQARRLLQESPGVAHAFVVDALRDLGRLTITHHDTDRRFF